MRLFNLKVTMLFVLGFANTHLVQQTSHSTSETTPSDHQLLQLESQSTYAIRKPGCSDTEAVHGEKERGYRGCQQYTVSGALCQNWGSDARWERSGWIKEKYELGLYGLGNHNYCRNPDLESVGIWCYTTTSLRWEQCDPLTVDEIYPERKAKAMELFRNTKRWKKMVVDTVNNGKVIKHDVIEPWMYYYSGGIAYRHPLGSLI